MNTLRNSLLIGLTMLSMGTASLAAQAADAPAPNAKWAEHMAQRQARLHDLLKLSPAQEPAWNTFIASAMPPGAGMHRPEHDAMRQMTAPDRLANSIQLSQDRLAMLESRLGALKTLYATLTAAQQKILDDHTPGGEHGAHYDHLQQ